VQAEKEGAVMETMAAPETVTGGVISTSPLERPTAGAEVGGTRSPEAERGLEAAAGTTVAEAKRAML